MKAVVFLLGAERGEEFTMGFPSSLGSGLGWHLLAARMM